MNLTVKGSVSLIKNLKKETKKIHNKVVVCPPFTSLNAVSIELKGSKIILGAQNMHYENSGAYTGEISPAMLKELGCTYVILGHSERRNYFSEGDDLINKKMISALSNELIPILCVGEKIEHRNLHIQNKIVESQLNNCLRGITKTDFVVAYEPVWAIGTGNNATPEQAEEMHSFIRGALSKNFTSSEIKILYGGSVNPENAKNLLSRKNIDGLLVGGASLKAESFVKIVNSF